MKIIEYEVVRGNDDNFVERMNDAIANGWQPQGGICVHPYLQYNMQAVVRYETPPKKTKSDPPNKTGVA